MNTFSRLALLGVMLNVTGAYLHAGIQNGRNIPDEILVLNDTNQVATINGQCYNPQQEARVLTTDQAGAVELQVGDQSYVFVYPLYQEGVSTQEIWSFSRATVSDIMAGRAAIE